MAQPEGQGLSSQRITKAAISFQADTNHLRPNWYENRGQRFSEAFLGSSKKSRVLLFQVWVCMTRLRINIEVVLNFAEVCSKVLRSLWLTSQNFAFVLFQPK